MTPKESEKEGFFEQVVQVLLESKDDEARLRAAIVIGQPLETKAISPLTKALKRDKAKYVRATCASFLGPIGQLTGNLEVIRSVINAAKDEDAYVRKAVAGTLYGIEDPNAHKALEKLAKDSNDEVRNTATRMLDLKRRKAHGLCPFLDDQGVCIGWFLKGETPQECSWEIRKEGLDHKACALYPLYQPYESVAFVLTRK